MFSLLPQPRLPHRAWREAPDGRGAGTWHVWGRLWSGPASAKPDTMGDSGQLTIENYKKKPNPTGAHTEGATQRRIKENQD